jgi:putative phosphoesterase
MKIGVLSDTHDNLENIRKAVQEFLSRGVGAVLHGGDFCSPFTLAEFKPLADKGVEMHAVFGNNDGDRVLLWQRARGICDIKDGASILTIGGKRIVLMHYPELAEDLYRGATFDLVVYGHDHKIRVEGGGKKILNPGTCSGYLAQKATVVAVDTHTMDVEEIEL